MRRAKIVCTIGPATASEQKIKELVATGMDVARLNLSHGSHEVHHTTFTRVRAAAEHLGRGVGILADLQGPKIRLARFSGGPVMLIRGAAFTITTEDVDGTVVMASTTYKGLADDVVAGERILVDDGKVTLEVIKVDGPRVVTRVIEAGFVSDNKGLNIPGAALSVPALSDKDVEDLRWALRTGVDMIALSFVRSAADLDRVHEVMDEVGVRLPVIAKIEKPQAVDNLQEIVDAFDGIMVARGDLGVELPLEQVPLVQKRAVAMAREVSKPVIVATQMLDSMIGASRPTRAETSDVANAVLDGADAVMLSGETSVGEYPIESVATMARIIATVEGGALDKLPELTRTSRTQGGAIAKAAVQVGEQLGATFLVAFTQSGESARRVAHHRSAIPLLAFTPEPAVRNQLALQWGVETFLVPTVSHTDEMFRQVDAALLELGRAREGDAVVVVAGTPPGIAGSTNSMRVHRLGAGES